MLVIIEITSLITERFKIGKIIGKHLLVFVVSLHEGILRTILPRPLMLIFYRA